jgi:signal transduction histidine kinase
MPSAESTAILLVDDEEGIRNVLGITLKDMGYSVYAAADSREALDIFRQERPPIVLTDIKMPGLDGIDLLRIIKEESPDTEVIMITGHGDLNLAIKSLKSEAADFIAKPIQDEVLEIALKRVAEKISLKRQLKAYTEGLEQLIEEKSRELVEAERLTAIGQTVAGLSHSIKNITGGLKGGAFVLEKGIDLEDMAYLKGGWEMVKGNVDRIAQLSLDLLNYAKTADINHQIWDPNQPVRDVIDLLTPSAREKGITFELDLASDIDPFQIDPEGIHQCLVNVITNGMDACELDANDDGGKIVTIRTARGQDGGIVYRIRDTGCGMTSDTQKKLFQQFFTTKGIRGTGIGLMMTRNIVEKHQGRIDVQSEAHVGTTVTIEIPDPSTLDIPPIS